MSLRARLNALFLVCVAIPAVLIAALVFRTVGVVGFTVGVLVASMCFGLVISRAVRRDIEPRLHELSQERARLRESIRRTGETLASNLDRPALLELTLKTAVDAVHASAGRLIARSSPGEPLAESAVIGSAMEADAAMHKAEHGALRVGGIGESRSGDHFLASVALGHANPLHPTIEQSGRLYGLITVGRTGSPFSDEERDLLRMLGAQATLALENVELHYQVRRQAATDELTGLSNYAHFQRLLATEFEQVRRYGDPVGLVMLDLDDFKAVNDTFGHQQGDAVLRAVADILQETSREADSPARYGGDELVVVLPRTDLDGAFAIGDRVRRAIEELEIPRLVGGGSLRVTASIGVAASDWGDREVLVAEADRALYAAKREGKNRTARPRAETVDVSGE
jgi:diguanylate cyclase (GGDEF)-like protein